VRKLPKLRGRPRFSKDGQITNRGMDRLCEAIQEDEAAHPDDVRAAVRRGYASLNGALGGEGSAHSVDLAFLALCLSRYLDGSRSFDQAFGVATSRPGHPGIPTHEQMAIAREVWSQYLPSTESLKSVARRVGDERGKGKTQVLEYFHRYFLANYCRFVRDRDPRNPWRPNTSSESRRFLKLNKLHEKRADKQPADPAMDGFTITRHVDGTIAVERPWPHLRSRSTKSNAI
jgi:hypothetical protein